MPSHVRRKPDFRSRSKNEKMASIENVLKSALRRAGIDQDIARYEFVLHWDRIVGADIAKRSRPESLRAGLLSVRVSDAAWAQELSFYKGVIISRLQQFLSGAEKVRDVRFFVGEL